MEFIPIGSLMIKRILAAAALTMAVTSISACAMAASDESTEARTGGVAERVRTATVSPTVSPAAEKTFHQYGGLRYYDCPSGRLCVDVWDHTKDIYKVFQFNKCQTHSVLAFYSTYVPEFENDQASGTVTRFKNGSGSTIKTSTAKHGERSISWAPVYDIDVC